MKHNLQINISVKFDKPTESFIVYSKKYDISGYGKTLEQALEMFDFTVKESILSTLHIPEKHD